MEHQMKRVSLLDWAQDESGMTLSKSHPGSHTKLIVTIKCKHADLETALGVPPRSYPWDVAAAHPSSLDDRLCRMGL